MLMDEPLSNLDAKLRNQMRAEIIKLRKNIDTTFIYVTHDQTEAMTLGDRIVIMKDGFIQQIGTPQEVFNHPYNLFVATFIGTPQMNLFENAELVKENGRYFVEIDGFRTELSEEKQRNLTQRNVSPQPVTLGVRPEHTHLSDREGLDAVVDVSEMMGSSVHLHVSVLGQDVVLIVSTLNMNHAELDALQSGSHIRFSFTGDICHLFSKETGINLEA
jgi:multiple sugar transport system ATP-binding protein